MFGALAWVSADACVAVLPPPTARALPTAGAPLRGWVCVCRREGTSACTVSILLRGGSPLRSLPRARGVQGAGLQRTQLHGESFWAVEGTPDQ